jgi:hypothetical protein
VYQLFLEKQVEADAFSCHRDMADGGKIDLDFELALWRPTTELSTMAFRTRADPQQITLTPKVDLCYWQSLRHLTLYWVRATMADLAFLFLMTTKTLRELELTSIQLGRCPCTGARTLATETAE